jgi:hypothetical protein
MQAGFAGDVGKSRVELAGLMEPPSPEPQGCEKQSVAGQKRRGKGERMNVDWWR